MLTARGVPALSNRWALHPNLKVLVTWLRWSDGKPNATSLDSSSLSFVIALMPSAICDGEAIIACYRSIWVAVNVVALAFFCVLEPDSKSGVSRVGLRHDLVAVKVVEMFSN